MAKGNEKIYVAITNIKHGNGEVDEEGLPIFDYVESGQTLGASDFSEELLASWIASGSIAERLDVIVVQDDAKIAELSDEVTSLSTENAELSDENAKLKAELEALKKSAAPPTK